LDRKSTRKRIEDVSPMESKAYIRTSILLSSSIDRNLEAYSILRKLTKNQAMVALIIEALEKNGFQPEKEPLITITYN
jgi:hypothetical protein